ncbi:hypothetical protein SK224_14545 [Microbacterium sp. BG28]|uniref:LGFP repeat-containing protein n=1 Tax=Microbacterium sp. BG28 TaxID=3097356 RepID=UPI002A5AFA75|nr:hypothetical protein [Microbacterium sp. BG28]MDY0830350.1 hypothetical protein [Microbacterium sp. BG28]
MAILGVVVAVVASLTAVILPPAVPTALAADASSFQDGYLISDRNFFDSQSMTASDAQAFLNSKLSSCAGSNGMPCLKDYVAQSTPAVPANAYCNAYPGGTMTAAQLVVAVSQACGINPKVILVMLQKEQGLVTATSPTPRNYSAALGQGCPDGAACDPQFAGFFYQIYGAAKQFQVYLKNPRSFGYQLGWNNILYQATPPDNSRVCGTKRVYIQNDATRALYIYTPYTPNQAALNNLYGTGDFCSSYGNRNFWRLYTDWFGDPTAERVTGAYADTWAALGGVNGILGAPTGDVVCINSRYCQQAFRGGTIFWFPGRGVFGVPTVIESMWRNIGFIDGDAGMPTGVVVCVSDGTCSQSFDGGVIAADAVGGNLVGRHVASTWLAVGGVSLGGARGPEVCTGSQCAQLFARGALFSGSAATSITGSIFNVWSAAGMSGGSLGYPSADAVCVTAGCTQRFDGGLVVSGGDHAEIVPAAIATKFFAIGGVSAVGGPVGPASCDAAGACFQRFQGARIDVSPARGSIATTKWFLDAWAARGFEQGQLRYPTAEASCSTVTCSQPFEGGVLSGSPSNGVVAVYGEYRDVWMASGGPSGSLGLPLAGDSCNGRNCAQSFQRGVLAWTPQYGMITVSSWFLAPWQAQGAGSGRLGAPMAAATCSAVTCSQAFEGGVLSGSPSNGVVAVYGEYRDVWMASGGPSGSLGLPLAGDSCNGRNCAQSFQRGVLAWTPQYGMITVSSWFLAPWQAQGAGSGRLGAPTAAATCSAVTCSQAFEGGVLSGSPSNGVVAVYGEYRDVWMASGGPSGSLGLPLAGDSCNGRWCVQGFQRGSIVWSPATGIRAVAEPIAGRWNAAGGADGTYGLPTGSAAVSGNSVSQQFQRGTITANR